MFPNLDAELARKNISTKELAKMIGTSEKTVNNKRAGRTEFTLSEIKIISGLFPDASLDYLFAKKTEQPA